jgi:hypothetical protein
MIFEEMLSVAKKNLNRFRFDTIRIHTFLSKAAQKAQQQPMPSFARSSWSIVSESENPLIFSPAAWFSTLLHVARSRFFRQEIARLLCSIGKVMPKLCVLVKV